MNPSLRLFMLFRAPEQVQWQSVSNPAYTQNSRYLKSSASSESNGARKQRQVVGLWRRFPGPLSIMLCASQGFCLVGCRGIVPLTSIMKLLNTLLKSTHTPYSTYLTGAVDLDFGSGLGTGISQNQGYLIWGPYNKD